MEPSPVARRKLSPKEKRQQDRDRFLTFTKEQEEMMDDQEMEATLTQSRVARLDDKGGFRQSARALDDDRFRTRTITKEENRFRSNLQCTVSCHGVAAAKLDVSVFNVVKP